MPAIVSIGLLFYRQFIWAAQILNLVFIGGYLFWDKNIALLGNSILIKATLWSVLYFFYNQFLSQRYIFYFNLGVSKRALWLVSLCLDALSFFFLVFLANNVC